MYPVEQITVDGIVGRFLVNEDVTFSLPFLAVPEFLD
jgi:hypothetical protein